MYVQVNNAFTAILDSNFGIGLALLEGMKPLVWLDPIISDNIDLIYDKIFENCFSNFLHAFSRIGIATIAEKFNMKHRYA